MDGDVEAFKKLLTRLTPAASSNIGCIKWLNSYTGDFSTVLKTFVDVMIRSSLNARARQIYLLEYSAGLVGSLKGPDAWIGVLTTNLQRVVDAAVPIHLAPSALVNIKPTKQLVTRLHSAGLIDETQTERVIAQIDSKYNSIRALSANRQGKYHASRDEVLRRMEDDRERGKKYRERELSSVIGSKQEFDEFWEKIGPIDEADEQNIRKEASQLS